MRWAAAAHTPLASPQHLCCGLLVATLCHAHPCPCAHLNALGCSHGFSVWETCPTRVPRPWSHPVPFICAFSDHQQNTTYHNVPSHTLSPTSQFREVLEALLDDDKDMWEMNLTAKEAARRAAEEAALAALEGLQHAASSMQGPMLQAVAEDEVMHAPVDERPTISPFELHNGPDALVAPLSPSPSRPVVVGGLGGGLQLGVGMGPGGVLGGSPPGMSLMPLGTPGREFAPLGRLSRRSMATSYRTGG